MIVFPNLENYVSDYKNDYNVITIRIYEYPNKNTAKYFNVRTPFPYGAFVEMLQQLANQRLLPNLRIEQVEYRCCGDEINIWQLSWYLKNIKDSKVTSVTVLQKDGKEVTYRVDVTNERALKCLMENIKNSAH